MNILDFVYRAVAPGKTAADDAPAQHHAALHADSEPSPMDQDRHGGVLGYVVFDLETDGLFADRALVCHQDQQHATVPNITCACSTRLVQGVGGYQFDQTREWHGDLSLPCPMPLTMVHALIDYLSAELAAGYPPLAWNGAGFDFRVLYELAETQEHKTKALHLGTHGVDPMFNFFMHKGFPVAMHRVASGFALPINKSGEGGDAVTDWLEGDATARKAVVAYCARDVAVLAMVVVAIEASNEIRWVTKASGRVAEWAPGREVGGGGGGDRGCGRRSSAKGFGGDSSISNSNTKKGGMVKSEDRVLMTIGEAMRLEQPDNSWMAAGVGRRGSRGAGQTGAAAGEAAGDDASGECAPQQQPRYDGPPTKDKFIGWVTAALVQ